MPAASWYDNLFDAIGSMIATVDQIRDMNTGRQLMQAPPRTASPPDVLDPTPRPDLPYQRVNINAKLLAADMEEVQQDLKRTFNTFQDQATGWIVTLAGKVSQILLDREYTLNELGGLSESPSIEEVLIQLYRAMLDDGQSVLPSNITIGTVGAARDAFGVAQTTKGFVYVTEVLDAVSAPTDNAIINPYYASATTQSQLAVPGPQLALPGNADANGEEMILTCTADSFSNGLPQNAETFLWEGQPGDGSGFDWRKYEGSNVRRNLTVLDADDSFVANRDFESFSPTNQPASWTIVAGTPGTHILQETQSAAVFRGLNSLKFTGDGAQSSIEISQNIFGLQANTCYFWNLWLRGEAGISSGTFDIQLGNIITVSLTAGTLSGLTNWTKLQDLGGISFKTGASVPDFVTLTLRWRSTPSAHSIWIDGLAMGRPVWANGVGVAIIGGAEPFEAGDRFTMPVMNEEARFQRFMRRQYQFQLPSNPSPTQADSKAAYEQ